MIPPIRAYLKEIEKGVQSGIATERSHYPALKRLLEGLASGITATNEPKRIECGAPDFQISRKTPHGPMTIGYAEAKDVGRSLEEIEREARRAAPSTLEGKQLKRYLTLGNLLLTNCLDFRWYVDGELRSSATLARLTTSGRLAPEKDEGKAVEETLIAFLSHAPQPISKPRDLALRMARLTHIIRDVIVNAFESGKASEMLRDLRKAFAQTLIPDLEEPNKTEEFADMFAQTLAYGLFAARCNHRGPGLFQRLGAAREIPKTNPFLRELFDIITGTRLDDEPFAGFVDDLAQLLAQAEIESILADFGKRTRREDPVVHFYETFLAAYDSRIREMRGVYFTPEPVVSYIVRSVDYLLRTRFNCTSGLADAATVSFPRGTGVSPVDSGTAVPAVNCKSHEQDARATHGLEAHATQTCPRVLILDPACGTGTFLYAVVDHIREEFTRRNDAGMWSGFVKEQLLPRLFGFELLMAPYAVAHFKLGMQLAGQDLSEAQRANWAYDFSGDERLGIYLTNTLEEAERRAETLFGPLRIISEEANAAANIKRDLPIMVVMGNPPYSGHSANRSWEIRDGKKARTFIGNLVQDYYKVDGRPLGEKNPKWLQDDYVKFIRFGQWRIEQTGAGILAFITNHGYLDNPTFRGMRQQLMNAFTDIYILNLHGNAKKKEKSPDGSKDENVFDIQQGVAIGIFVREPGKPGPARVHYADLWGLRESKYAALFAQQVADTRWQELVPRSPFYMFIPRGTGVSPVKGGHGLEAHATPDSCTGEGGTGVSPVIHGQDLSRAKSRDAHATVDLCAEYEREWKVTQVFPVNSVGVVTARDSLTIQWSAEEVWQVVEDFASLPEDEARQRYSLPKDARDWKVALAQQDLRDSGPAKDKIAAMLYRPFDLRHTYYTGRSRGFICMPRPEVTRHMLAEKKKNVGLLSTRQTRDEWGVLATRGICGHKSFSAYDITSLFPLYLYPASDAEKKGQKRLLEASSWPPGREGRLPNLNPQFVADLEKRLGWKFISDGRGDLGLSGAAVPAVNKSGTGVSPVNYESHEQDARATGGQDAHATFFNLRCDDSLRIRQGAYLPHWTREGATYSVIFRLADSLPQEVLQGWLEERERLIKRAKKKSIALPKADEKNLQKLFSEKIEKCLDSGIGECWLKRDDVAQLVANAMMEFDGERYDLIAWCIMPNHVHVIVRPTAGNTLPEILHSWKSFSAKHANKLLERTGTFWQTESYDHLIRDAADYYHCVEYVLQNPEKAGLENWKWRAFSGGTAVPAVNKSGTGVSPVNYESHERDAHATHGQDAHATFGPEDVFNYIYAVLHSPTYRRRYAEFLKIDFPRLPLTSDANLFRTLCAKGAELVALHLLEAPVLQKPITRYPEKGDNLIEKGFPKYLAPGEKEPVTGESLKEGRVYISADKPGAGKKGQYFHGVPPEVWNFQVGGYQVCEKWLKDRRGRNLSYEERITYQKIAAALKETIRLMAEIDAAIPRWPIE